MKYKETIATNIGNLCSRQSLVLDDIYDCLTNGEKEMDFLTKDDLKFFNTYVEDAKGAMQSCLENLKRVSDNEIRNNLTSIVENNKDRISAIEDKIKAIKIRDEDKENEEHSSCFIRSISSILKGKFCKS